MSILHTAFILSLTAVGLLAGCRSISSNVHTVRNGYLEYNKTITLGQSLEHTFANGEWKSFTADKGATIVEFDGSAPFSKFRGDCTSNLICSALDQNIHDRCNSSAGQVPYVQAYQDQKANIKAKLAEVSRKTDALYSLGVHDGEFNKLSIEEGQLMAQLTGIMDPTNSCLDSAYNKVADDPIPITVQFSINSDGSFQYFASNFSESPERLLYNMYK
jgi:hypothetical protein